LRAICIVLISKNRVRVRVLNVTFNNISVISRRSALLVDYAEKTTDLQKVMGKNHIMLYLATKWPSWSWSYGSLIYNYLCNQCLSSLTLWVRIPLIRGVLDTTLCDKVCQCLVVGRRFFSGTPVSSTNKTDCHDISEILLKVR
jgi:hypothetical protein